MYHGRAKRRFNRTAEHRKAMFSNMCQNLIKHEQIVTTLPKAKELRPIAERVITQGKRGTVHARRLAQRWIADRTILKKLFDEIAPRMKDREGGYLRIVKLGQRQGDAAEVAILEFVDFVFEQKAPKADKKADKAKAAEAEATDESGEEKPKKKATAKKAKPEGDSKLKKTAKPSGKADSKSRGGAKKGSTPRKAGTS